MFFLGGYFTGKSLNPSPASAKRRYRTAPGASPRDHGTPQTPAPNLAQSARRDPPPGAGRTGPGGTFPAAERATVLFLLSQTPPLRLIYKPTRQTAPVEDASPTAATPHSLLRRRAAEPDVSRSTNPLGTPKLPPPKKKGVKHTASALRQNRPLWYLPGRNQRGFSLPISPRIPPLPRAGREALCQRCLPPLPDLRPAARDPRRRGVRPSTALIYLLEPVQYLLLLRSGVGDGREGLELARDHREAPLLLRG